MCGIFGILNFSTHRLEDARNALHTITHRGPDQWGEHVGNGIYLGHRRLSIRDLSENGRQPFVDPETGVAVIVNGEIWNDKALRAQLGESRFRGHSDCEVFLHGYLTWGLESLLQRLDGFFAAAIHDPRDGSLHLIKDRFGKKPLYFAQSEKVWVFASEAKAILAYSPEFRVFDLQGIQHWITYRGSRQPKTIFKGVKKLTAGCYLSINKDGQAIERSYYDLIELTHQRYPAKFSSDEHLDEHVEHLLGKAIEKRFLSDVPVGLQLSGGVDSSLVAVLSREQRSEPLHTYTVTFPSQQDQSFDESHFAREVARHCDFIHHEIPVDNASITEAFPHVVWLFDGMLDIPNAIPIHLLACEAKKDVSVLLTGEGADELFGGYGKFSWGPGLLARQKTWQSWIPDSVFSALPMPMSLQHKLRETYLTREYAGQANKLLTGLNCFVTPNTSARLLGTETLDPLQGLNSQTLCKLPFAKQMQLVDQLTYLNFLLERQDKASMGHAMEARLPFLDQALIEAIMPVASEVLFAPGALKKPLKRLLAKRMGAEFTYRQKVGFALPIENWLHDKAGMGRYVEQALAPDFLLWQQVDRNKVLDFLKSDSYSLRQVSYGDDERLWMRWFLAVLAVAQEAFAITGIETS